MWKKFNNFFKKINELLLKKQTKYVMFVIAIVLALFIMFKDKKTDIRSIKDIKKQLPEIQIKDIRDNVQEDNISIEIIKDDDTDNKPAEKPVEKKSKIKAYQEREIKKMEELRSVKTELIPDNKIYTDADLEKQVVKPVNILYKMKKIDDLYKVRVKKNRIKYGKTVKYGDTIYFRLDTEYTIDELKGADMSNNYFVSMMLLDKSIPMSQLLVEHKVGDRVRIDLADLYKVMEKSDDPVLRQQVVEAKKAIQDDPTGSLREKDLEHNVIFYYRILDIVSNETLKAFELK